jgi:hypothetical protein
MASTYLPDFYSMAHDDPSYIAGGYTPDMIRRSWEEDQRRRQIEDMYTTAALGGASNEQLSSAFPELAFQRTGRRYLDSAAGNKLDITGWENMAPEDRSLLIRQNIESQELPRYLTQAKQTQELQDIRNPPPLASALRYLDPETARRAVGLQTGVTGAYGDQAAGLDPKQIQERILEKLKTEPEIEKAKAAQTTAAAAQTAAEGHKAYYEALRKQIDADLGSKTLSVEEKQQSAQIRAMIEVHKNITDLEAKTMRPEDRAKLTAQRQFIEQQIDSRLGASPRMKAKDLPANAPDGSSLRDTSSGDIVARRVKGQWVDLKGRPIS